MTTTFLAGKSSCPTATVIYGFVPALVDLNKTHATNPLWVGHTVFHVVWQVMIQAGIRLLEPLQSLDRFPIETAAGHQSFRSSADSIVQSSFRSMSSRKFYQGTLADQTEFPDVWRKVDTNVFSFHAGTDHPAGGYSLARFA